jgi:hypothetical protein
VNVLQAMAKAMPWAPQAACRESKLNWIVEPSQGRENPGTVVRLFDVCADCPVRVECLRYALEAEFSVMGVWGGSTMTERRHILPLDGMITRHENRLIPRQPREHGRQVEEAIELLESTFPARRNGWRKFADEDKAERAEKKAATGP